MTTKTKTVISLIDPTTEQAIREYHAVKKARSSLEKREKELKTQLAELMVRYQDEYQIDTDALPLTVPLAPLWYSFNGAEIRPRSLTGAPRISGDKLLERGVDPEILAFATTSTPYTQYDTDIREE